MASTFAGKSLFNSGPHRFAIRRVGRLTRGPFATPLDLPYTTDEGVRELAIFHRGRLVATTNLSLWSKIDLIQTEAEAITVGTLIDHQGRSWSDMTLIRFEPSAWIDRGRVFTMTYEALYLRFGP